MLTFENRRHCILQDSTGSLSTLTCSTGMLCNWINRNLDRNVARCLDRWILIDHAFVQLMCTRRLYLELQSRLLDSASICALLHYRLTSNFELQRSPHSERLSYSHTHDNFCALVEFFLRLETDTGWCCWCQYNAINRCHETQDAYGLLFNLGLKILSTRCLVSKAVKSKEVPMTQCNLENNQSADYTYRVATVLLYCPGVL